MTTEDRELLYKDLCARVPYGVLCYTPNGTGTFSPLKCITETYCYFNDNPRYGNNYPIEYIKPYLRPMSSMTEEEKEDMHNILSPDGTAIYENEGIATPCNHHGEWVPYEFMARIVDWLNAHHFDHNGLIEKGLALEAPEGMYKE